MTLFQSEPLPLERLLGARERRHLAGEDPRRRVGVAQGQRLELRDAHGLGRGLGRERQLDVAPVLAARLGDHGERDDLGGLEFRRCSTRRSCIGSQVAPGIM